MPPVCLRFERAAPPRPHSAHPRLRQPPEPAWRCQCRSRAVGLSCRARQSRLPSCFALSAALRDRSARSWRRRCTGGDAPRARARARAQQRVQNALKGAWTRRSPAVRGRAYEAVALVRAVLRPLLHRLDVLSELLRAVLRDARALPDVARGEEKDAGAHRCARAAAASRHALRRHRPTRARNASEHGCRAAARQAYPRSRRRRVTS